MRKTLKAILAASKKVTNEKGCHIWQGNTNQFGYGLASWKKKNGKRTTTTAHRAVWIQCKGPLKRHQKVCHSCDEPLCVNLKHLFIGTQKANMADMYSKGRGYKSKLKRRDQWSDRFSALSENDVETVAEEFGVGIRTAMRWKQRMLSSNKIMHPV